MNFLSKINGYKTYGLQVITLILIWAAHFWGPFTVQGQNFPALTTIQALTASWGCLTALFIRHGMQTGA